MQTSAGSHLGSTDHTVVFTRLTNPSNFTGAQKNVFKSLEKPQAQAVALPERSTSGHGARGDVPSTLPSQKVTGGAVTRELEASCAASNKLSCLDNHNEMNHVGNREGGQTSNGCPGSEEGSERPLPLPLPTPALVPQHRQEQPRVASPSPSDVFARLTDHYTDTRRAKLRSKSITEGGAGSKADARPERTPVGPGPAAAFSPPGAQARPGAGTDGVLSAGAVTVSRRALGLVRQPTGLTPSPPRVPSSAAAAAAAARDKAAAAAGVVSLVEMGASKASSKHEPPLVVAEGSSSVGPEPPVLDGKRSGLLSASFMQDVLIPGDAIIGNVSVLMNQQENDSKNGNKGRWL